MGQTKLNEILYRKYNCFPGNKLGSQQMDSGSQKSDPKNKEEIKEAKMANWLGECSVGSRNKRPSVVVLEGSEVCTAVEFRTSQGLAQAQASLYCTVLLKS
jgi:hypothetical protein